MGAIDMHQHLWPRAFVEALTRRTETPYLDGSMLALPEGTYEVDLDDNLLERRLALLDAAGIDMALVSLQPTLGLEALRVTTERF